MEDNGLVHLEENCTFDPHRCTRGWSHGSLSLSETIYSFLFGSLLVLKTEARGTLLIYIVSPKEDAENLFSKYKSCLYFRGLSEQTFFLENQYEFYVFWDIFTAWSNFTFIDMAYFSQVPYSYTLMLSYLKKLEQIHVNTLTHQKADNYYKNVFWYSATVATCTKTDLFFLHRFELSSKLLACSLSVKIKYVYNYNEERNESEKTVFVKSNAK